VLSEINVTKVIQKCLTSAYFYCVLTIAKVVLSKPSRWISVGISRVCLRFWHGVDIWDSRVSVISDAKICYCACPVV